MAYLNRNALKSMGFKRLGEDVKISTRAVIYDPECLEIGDHIRIDDFCLISGRVVLGSFIHLAPYCLIAGGEHGVFLDDFAGLSYRVQVFSQSDDYSGASLTNSTTPSHFKNERKEAVYVRRHVIVGAGSTVFPGVIIDEGCAIGAMSLVDRSTEPWGIYSGIPARRLKERKKDLLEKERLFFNEINR